MPQGKMKIKAKLPSNMKQKAKKLHSAARKAVPMKAKNLTTGAKITQQGEKVLRNRIEKAARALAQPEEEAKKSKRK